MHDSRCDDTAVAGCCAQVAQGFGLLLGTVCMNPKTAQTIASIVVLGFTLVGGYFVRGARPFFTCAWCPQEGDDYPASAKTRKLKFPAVHRSTFRVAWAVSWHQSSPVMPALQAVL